MIDCLELWDNRASRVLHVLNFTNGNLLKTFVRLVQPCNVILTIIISDLDLSTISILSRISRLMQV